MAYSYNDIKEAYRKAGVTRGRVVLVKTDLRYLGAFESPKRKDILSAHFNALADLVDLGVGTIVVQTHSTGLCNTDTPFDRQETPSERGVLTEFIRRQQGAVRSWHPFMSYAAVGAHADAICTNVSRHSFGLETPKARMLDLDAMCLSIGLEPRKTCTYVHHMELLMGVPYRYTKEFSHPVVMPDGRIETQPFYMFVWYRGMDLHRDGNRKLFRHLEKTGLTMRDAALGKGHVYGYSCPDFCKHAAKFFRDDIYGWTEREPAIRPYTV
ncbi:MAG: aminoglycoside 3-N-acetyltransferase [Desulfovibrionales bacterium]|nr:aminoglycoside 3-N-acetyltransferase [Desulfovibrionales bacterium]